MTFRGSAGGINVVYDVRGAQDKVIDTEIYTDGASASAKACASAYLEYTENGKTYAFDHWVDRSMRIMHMLTLTPQ